MIDKLALAERQLDRMQSFFPRIDTKVTAVAAWLSVEIAVTALNIKLGDLAISFVFVPFAVLIVACAVSALRIWQCVFPDRKGGQGSLIYFGAVAEKTEGSFRAAFRAATEDEILDDVIGQVWRNAEIVCAKYTAVQSGIRWATISLGALIILLVSTSVHHNALPILPGN